MPTPKFTIRDVSKLAQVSITTVSNVLNGTGDYQEVGIELAEIAWLKAIHQASSQTDIRLADITDASFCLAGATCRKILTCFGAG
jgi:hypothetical protein